MQNSERDASALIQSQAAFQSLNILAANLSKGILCKDEEVFKKHVPVMFPKQGSGNTCFKGS